MNVVQPHALRFRTAALLIAAAVVCWCTAARAELRALPDSTRAEEWRLSNGLRVVIRDVPYSTGVAITLAFPFGSEQDPRDREGWAALLAHVEFLSAGVDAPERTLDDMGSSRPLGWRIDVHRRVTRLTELATQPQFPGVLHQIAGRLRAPAPTAQTLAAARGAVHTQMLQNYRVQLPAALHYRLHDAGTSQGLDVSDRYAEAKGLDSATLQQVAQSMRERFVPANAVLSLAGDLRQSGMDLKRVLENEFGSIPAGTAAPETSPMPLHAAVRVVDRAGIPFPVGAIGLIAPALSDTSHPSFFMNALVAGTHLAGRWGRTAYAPSPFQYSLFDDPDLVRIYPPVTPSDLDSTRIREEYLEGLLAVSGSTISYDAYSDLHDGVLWMLGGPLTLDLIKRSRTDPGLLATLATTGATRELWGGEPFWSEYRRRFIAVDHPAFARWAEYFRSPSRQVQLIVVPADPTPPPKKH